MTTPTKTARDLLREKALASNRRKTAIVDAYGTKIEIRQSSLADILASASEEHKSHSLAFMMVKTVFVPETGEPLFEMGDIDAMMALPFDEDMQAIADKLNSFNGIKVVEAKKG